jgi:predicted HAD superfamily Cof-like phosphohydrolase
MAVKEFHEAFDIDMTLEAHAGLIDEEAEELAEAIELDDGSLRGSVNRLKETVDLLYVTLGFQIAAEKVAATNPARLSDETLLVISMAVAEAMEDFGSDEFFEAFHRVHTSNMTKLGDNGLPIRRPEDGKILKGPNYQPAILGDLV